MKPDKIIVFLLLLVLLAAGRLTAQSPALSVSVAELPVQEDDSPYRVITLGRLGVLVVMEQNDLFAVRPQRGLLFYDENLRKRGRRTWKWKAVSVMRGIG